MHPQDTSMIMAITCSNIILRFNGFFFNQKTACYQNGKRKRIGVLSVIAACLQSLLGRIQ
jgi:hypothetical protein